MAVTKTERIRSITIHYLESGDPTVEISSEISWDDPNDDQLPISRNRNRSLSKVTTTTTYDENTGSPTTTETTTDYSGEDAKIVAVCDLVWPTE